LATLLANIPARGHINPTLPVVADLVARGEHVIYCLPPEDESLVCPTGATFRPVANSFPEARERKGGAMSLSELPAAAVRSAIRTLPELLEIVAADTPSYVVYDGYCLAGRLVAQLAGLPAVATYATFAFNEQVLLSVTSGRLSDPSAQRGLPGFEEAMQELVAKFGAPPIGLFDLLHHPEPLNIAFLPREFQPAGETFDGHWVFVGPSLAPRPEAVALPLEHLRAARSPTFPSGRSTTNDPTSSGPSSGRSGAPGGEWSSPLANGWTPGTWGRYRTTSSSGPGCPSSRCSRRRTSSWVTGG
jgi:MGT family glycosyltransferase